MKKTYLILILLLLIIIAGGAWYFFFQTPEDPIVSLDENGLPFGSGEDINIPTTQNQNESGSGQNGEAGFDQFSSPTKNIFRLANTPIAGSVIFERGTDVVVRYAERATGHIYEVVLPISTSSQSFTKTRLTNNTLPKTYEAYFRNDGTGALFRSLRDESDEIENLAIALTPPKQGTTTDFYTVSATPIRGRIGSVALDTSNTLIYSLTDTARIVSSTLTGANTKTLLESKFTNWRLAASGNIVLIYPKAESSSDGVVYRLNTSSGSLSKLLGPLNGLVAIPNSSGSRVLYSYSDGNTTHLVARNIEKDVNAEISSATLAEKCIWSTVEIEVVYCGSPNSGLVPKNLDSWYRGETLFSDRIWRFETTSNIAQLLAEPKQELSTDIDLINPKLSPKEKYLIFTNKRDLSLWALRLK